MKADAEDASVKSPFLTEEDGAVTADWVVLAAAVALLSIPAVGLINASTQNATTEVANDVIAQTD